MRHGCPCGNEWFPKFEWKQRTFWANCKNFLRWDLLCHGWGEEWKMTCFFVVVFFVNSAAIRGRWGQVCTGAGSVGHANYQGFCAFKKNQATLTEYDDFCFCCNWVIQVMQEHKLMITDTIFFFSEVLELVHIWISKQKGRLFEKSDDKCNVEMGGDQSKHLEGGPTTGIFHVLCTITAPHLQHLLPTLQLSLKLTTFQLWYNFNLFLLLLLFL